MNFYKVASKDEIVILKIILQKYLHLNVLTKFTLCKRSNIIKTMYSLYKYLKINLT